MKTIKMSSWMQIWETQEHCLVSLSTQCMKPVWYKNMWFSVLQWYMFPDLPVKKSQSSDHGLLHSTWRHRSNQFRESTLAFWMSLLRPLFFMITIGKMAMQSTIILILMNCGTYFYVVIIFLKSICSLERSKVINIFVNLWPISNSWQIKFCQENQSHEGQLCAAIHNR